MAISKSLRFQILRRDGFKCRYCGLVAAETELTVDHVNPTALGGRDEPSNLVTACKDCNAGKSATPPDAPIVADVEEDAIRWTRAMQAAAASMLADFAAREAVRDSFKAWWERWYWGSVNAKEYAPLPATWEKSIDQIVAAGLPIELIKDCIDTAFAYDKVKRENKFKYTCGVAWRKIEKLQEVARSRIDGHSDDGVLESAKVDRKVLVGELLDLLTSEEIEWNEIDEQTISDGILDEDGRDPIITAFEAVLYGLRLEQNLLQNYILDLLPEIPEGVGEQALKVARFVLYDVDAPEAGRARFVQEAVRTTISMLKVREALAHLDDLSPKERGEWIEYARALGMPKASDPWSHRLSCDDELVLAARASRVVKSGRFYPVMCLERGEHIEACPKRACYSIFFEELRCCSPDVLSENHVPHGFCEFHTEQVVDHGFLASTGRRFTVRDFDPLEEDDDAPPF